MADFGNEGGLWVARVLGASAGSMVSLVYMLPKSRHEAASRFLTGLVFGLIFGGPTGVWLVTRAGIPDTLSGTEILLAGSAAASVSAWWALGVLARVAERVGRRG